MRTAQGHVGFIVKDRWLGVRGDTDVGAWPFWKDQPLRPTSRLAAQTPSLCQCDLGWGFICTPSSSVRLGAFAAPLAPGHLGVGGGQGAVHLLGRVSEV